MEGRRGGCGGVSGGFLGRGGGRGKSNAGPWVRRQGWVDIGRVRRWRVLSRGRGRGRRKGMLIVEAIGNEKSCARCLSNGRSLGVSSIDG